MSGESCVAEAAVIGKKQAYQVAVWPYGLVDIKSYTGSLARGANSRR
jgi:hypothetical protein